MDRRRLMLAGILVVVMGAVFFLLNGMNQSSDTPVAAPQAEVIVKEVEYTRVLGIVEPRQKGSRIREGDLTWIDWPTEALTPALIIDDPTAEVPVTEQLVGALVRDPIQPGEPLTYSKFIRAGEAGIMAALLKPGMRATTVRISVDTAAGGFIQPGDRVDIILKEVLTGQAVSAGGTGGPEITAKTIFKDVLVLAIDQSFTNNPEGGAAIPGSTATLELSPEDSEDIIIAQDKGDLILLLRGFSGSTTPAPSRAAEPRLDQVAEPPLMVFRRGDVETVQLQQR